MTTRVRVALSAGAVVIAGTLAVWAGTRWQARSWAELEARFMDRAAPDGADEASLVDEMALGELPPPVARYLQRALPHGRRVLRTARFEQEGTLRTDAASERWMPFRATHLVAPTATEFAWSARVDAAPLIHLRVTDALIQGRGSGQVDFLSAFRISSAAGGPEMNSGALHRFLAEAVWYPTALLPSEKLQWTPIDESSALATLSDHGTTVTLEFRFDVNDEVIGIYTPARWGAFESGYEQRPWEGQFRHYREHAGMLVPSEGEVGWYSREGAWQSVWRGRITHSSYD